MTALRHDPAMAALVAAAGCVLMHMLGEPRTMQRDPRYGDVVDDVRAFLAERVAHALGAGVDRPASRSTPASASGRRSSTTSSSCRLDEIAGLGFPVVLGASRKSFLGRLTGREDPHDRVAATVATSVLGFERGARVFRVHDVAATADALAVAAATVRRP